MNDGWDKLLRAARAVLNEREVSPFVYAGQVGAAVETERGNIYVGACVDGVCGLSTCAERAALYAMLTAGEHRVRRVVAVKENGVVPPCGACREALMQLMSDAGNIEILLRETPRRVCALRELLPDWWGSDRFEDK